MLRNIVSVIVGIVTASVVIYGMEMLNGKMYPLPENLTAVKPENFEAFKEYLQTAPTGMFLMLIAGYALGSFFGGLVSAAIALKNKLRKSITVGGILTGLGMFNLFMLPHPIWVTIAVTLVYVPFALLGGMIGKRYTTKQE